MSKRNILIVGGVIVLCATLGFTFLRTPVKQEPKVTFISERKPKPLQKVADIEAKMQKLGDIILTEDMGTNRMPKRVMENLPSEEDAIGIQEAGRPFSLVCSIFYGTKVTHFKGGGGVVERTGFFLVYDRAAKKVKRIPWEQVKLAPNPYPDFQGTIDSLRTFVFPGEPVYEKGILLAQMK